VVQIPYADGDPLNGILAFLTKRHSCNLHNSGIVTVTGAQCSNIHIYTDPQQSSDYFHMTPDSSGCWFCFDFKERRVTLTHYAMKACCTNRGPSSWMLDGSNDGETWETLHSVEGCNGLRQDQATPHFAVSVSRSFRFVRFRQRANLPQSTDLHMKSFELFGSIEE
jgi:hypothetical protein